MEYLRELFHYRGLLYMITYRDIRVRYKQSIMGLMWAVLMPILVVMAGIVVRYAYSLAAHTQLQTADIASVAVKSLPWTFLVSSIRFGCNSLILSNQNLVTKIYFPREIFPMAAMLSSLFDFLIASGPLVIFLLLVHVHWSIYVAWVPVLLLILVAIASGVGFIVSTASLFFRDVKYIVEVLLTFGIFFTPVFFDVRMFGDKGKWLMLNPVAPPLEALSDCITRQQPPDLLWLGYSLAWGVLLVTGGYAFFKHLEPAFAESI
ncbi:MAG: ABC transporter permease [Candidatus Sulfotelmatobacter sp.]